MAIKENNMSLFPAPKNPNYAATVVKLKDFLDLPNCDNVKHAIVFGYHVIVGKDAKEGDVGLFFPVETQLLRDFLANNNLYRKAEWGNMDPSKVGFFEQHGRVKCMKFRGHKSEGFWIPLWSLSYLGYSEEEYKIGTTFDCVGDRPICKKYIPRFNSVVGNGAKTPKKRQPKLEDKLVEGQFAFHEDTYNLRKNIEAIHPDQWISITDKWHGTSAIFANVLVNKDLPWYLRALRWLGVPVVDTEYALTWASRRVIKGVGGDVKTTARHFYKEDIWSTVAKEIGDRIPQGFTVYGEIVGYTPSGQEIQKGYHYGCKPGEHRFLVYRVTYTAPNGTVMELGHHDIENFCAHRNLEMVKLIWYSKAYDLTDRGPEYWGSVQVWQEKLLEALERTYMLDLPCPFNNGEVPAEGIVVRIDHCPKFTAFKLKNSSFLLHETKMTDKGEIDMETQEEITAQDAEVMEA